MSTPPKTPPKSASASTIVIAPTEFETKSKKFALLAVSTKTSTFPGALAAPSAISPTALSTPLSIPLSSENPMTTYSAPSSRPNAGFSAASLRIPLLSRRESLSTG